MRHHPNKKADPRPRVGPSAGHRSTSDNEDSSTGKKHPISKGDIERSNDEHIDQDFPGFPHAPAREEVIRRQKTE